MGQTIQSSPTWSHLYRCAGAQCAGVEVYVPSYFGEMFDGLRTPRATGLLRRGCRPQSSNGQTCAVCSRAVCSRDVSTRDICSRDVCSRDVSTRDVCSRDVSTRDVCSRDVPSMYGIRRRYVCPPHDSVLGTPYFVPYHTVRVAGITTRTRADQTQQARRRGLSRPRQGGCH